MWTYVFGQACGVQRVASWPWSEIKHFRRQTHNAAETKSEDRASEQSVYCTHEAPRRDIEWVRFEGYVPAQRAAGDPVVEIIQAQMSKWSQHALHSVSSGAMTIWISIQMSEKRKKSCPGVKRTIRSVKELWAHPQAVGWAILLGVNNDQFSPC